MEQSTIDPVKEALIAENYIPTDQIATVLYLADKLEKPLLTEGPEDQFTDASQPVMIVAASSGEAPAEADRAAFARRAFETLAGVEKAQITTEATPAPGSIRIEGRGVDSDSGRPVQVVQVLRFEGKGYLRTVGIARTEVAGFGARVARLAGSLQAR